jgi:hypothetical protein
MRTVLLAIIVVAWTLAAFQYANRSVGAGCLAFCASGVWVHAGTMLGAEVRDSLRQALAGKTRSEPGSLSPGSVVEFVASTAGLGITLTIWVSLILTLICFISLNRYTRFDIAG